jgi:orotidine-5'-phosphate decarboxylase
MVALDVSSTQEAERIVQQLKGIPCWMKVGMQLFYAVGPDYVIHLKKLGYRVFLDLKMHDIPNTVKGGAYSVTKLGVDMFNVHAAGGIQMMEAALEGVDRAMTSKQTSPVIIAVTQLTSTAQSVLNDEIGILGSVEQSVLHYADLARRSGLHGVVASPLEVEAIKRHCGTEFLTVTPGIRPSGFTVGDQSRVMTPREALTQGTDYMVIGRPITAALDPRQAIESIIEEMK